MFAISSRVTQPRVSEDRSAARLRHAHNPGNPTHPASNMTCCDYNMVMATKGIGIADLKARLSEHLGMVRKGRSVIVLDRGTPVARIVPYAAEGLELRRATRRPSDLALPRKPSKPTDSLALLVDDRRRR